MAGSTPQDIAREAVKLLTARKLPPTPDNFQSAYHEVAGTRPLRPFPLESLHQIGQALPEGTPGQQRFKVLFNKAVSRHSWDDLQKLLTQQAWPSVAPATDSAPTPIATTGIVTAEADETGMAPEWCELVARIVTSALPALGEDDPRVIEQANELIAYLRQPDQHLPTLRRMLGDFAFRLSFVAEEQASIRGVMLGLLRQVFEHVETLSPDNPRLRQQLGLLIEAAQPPLSVRRLDDLQRRLRDVIVRQAEVRDQTLQAQAIMKETLATFLARLAQTSSNSSQYQAVFERCAEQLETAGSLAEMAPVMQEAIQAARTLATDSQRASEELTALRSRAEHAESEIERLQRALDQMAEAVTHDLLTGTLNRKGLLEVVQRETARAERTGGDLCIALLDIDDFKRLNDTMGHLAGDAALQHLANVARAALRPQDAIGRYGGEEFIIVLPDTSVEDAVTVIQRLQRDLSAHLFLSEDRRVLITFSAGVTALRPDEASEVALERADRAMYRAKRAGKNRVVAD